MHEVRHAATVLILAGLAGCGGGSTPPVPPDPPAPPVATSLAFRAQPASASSGTPIAPAVQVEVRDRDGSRMAGSTAQVSLALAAGPAGAELAGATTVAAVDGVATFTDLSVALAGTGLRLAATAPDLAGATSAAFDVAPGAPASLAFDVQPAGGTGGAAWPQAVVIAVRDAAGNLVPDVIAVSLALEGGPAGASLAGATAAPAVAGLATFGGLAVDLAGDGYRLTATATALPAALSEPFAVAVGPAARLAFTRQPSGARSAVAIAPVVVVEVRDAGGNLVTDGATQVTLGFPAGAGWPARLSGAGPVAESGGVARFPALAVDGEGSVSLVARAPGLAEAASATFQVTVAWVEAGPEGGYVNWLAQDPRSADAALAALGEGGLWRTLDLGASWSKVVLPGRPPVDGVAFAPSGAGGVVAWGAGGLLHGSGFGAAWRDASPPLSYVQAAWGPGDVLYALGSNPAGLSALVASQDAGVTWAPVEPALPDSHFGTFGVAADGTLFVNTTSGIIRLATGAPAWTAPGTGIPMPQLYALAFHPVDPLVAWAGTYTGVYGTADGGATWSAQPDSGSTVFGLHLDPEDPQVLTATTYGSGVWRTADGGASWVQAGELSSWATRAATGTGGRLLVGGASGAFASTDGGATWVRACAGLRAVGPVALAHHPSDAGTLLAGTTGGEIFLTRDRGGSWSRSEIAPGGFLQAFAWDAAAPGRAYAAADVFGVYRSVDGGLGWTRTTGFAGRVTSVAVGGGSPGAVWAVGENPSGLYRSEDGGVTFTRLAAFPAGGEPKGLAADPASPLVAWVTAGFPATPAATGLYRTGDGGASWALVAGTAALARGELQLVASTPQTMWVAAGSRYLRSEDGGATWSTVSPSPAPGQLWGLGVDPTDGRRAFIGSVSAGALVTADGGATWEVVRRGLPPMVNRLAVDPAAPGTVWAATPAGLYLTTNGGF